MSILEGVFDAEEYQSDGTATRTKRGAIPAGDYVAIAIESEVKTTKKGDGKYCQFKFVIIEGPHKEQYLWTRLNVANPNAVAQRIGNEQLATLCRAVGKRTIRATEELHQIPLILTVTMESRPPQVDGGDFLMVNEVTGFKPKAKPTLAQVAQTVTPF